MSNITRVFVVAVVAVSLFAPAGIASAQTNTSCYTFTQYLTRGSEGPEVRALQEKLKINLTLNDTALPVTGYFGMKTKAAVKAFQQKYEFPTITGNVGSVTRAKLNELYGCKRTTITVTSPNGGEAWRIGETRSIKWTSGGTVAPNYPVQIGIIDSRYSTEVGDRGERTIVNSTPNTGSYSWTIPEAVGTMSLTDTTQAVYKIVVHSLSSTVTGVALNDFSNAPFSITSSATPTALSITTASLPAGTVNVPYPASTLAYTGGSGGAALWAVTTGSLPLGIMLTQAGLLSGTPTTPVIAPVTTTFTVTVTVGAGASAQTATKVLSITVSPAPTATAGGTLDYNNDQKLDQTDVQFLLNLAVTTNKVCPTGKVCDLTGDGSILASDALKLAKYIGSATVSGQYDYDNNYRVDVADVKLLLQYAVGLGSCQTGKICDVNGSGGLPTASDAQMLQQYVGGEAVSPAGTPTGSITATPTTVESGGIVTLNWSSASVGSCTVTGMYGDSRLTYFYRNATSGTNQTHTPSSNITYILECFTDGYSVLTRSTSVTVTGSILPPTITTVASQIASSEVGGPTATFTATSGGTTVSSGGTITVPATTNSYSGTPILLAWNVQGLSAGAYCRVQSAGSTLIGGNGVQGSTTFAPKQNTTATLTCYQPPANPNDPNAPDPTLLLNQSINIAITSSAQSATFTANGLQKAVLVTTAPVALQWATAGYDRCNVTSYYPIGTTLSTSVSLSTTVSGNLTVTPAQPIMYYQLQCFSSVAPIFTKRTTVYQSLPVLTVTSPNANTIWQAGTSRNIEFTWTGLSTWFRVQLIQVVNGVDVAKGYIPNSSTTARTSPYALIMPAGTVAGTYKVRLEDNYGPGATGVRTTSSAFSVTAGTVLGANTLSTTENTCSGFSVNVARGASGAQVTALQNALVQDGATVEATGYFGPITAAAVRTFQEKYASEILTPNGLTVGTGFVGASTRAKLNALFGCDAITIGPTPLTTDCALGDLYSSMTGQSCPVITLPQLPFCGQPPMPTCSTPGISCMQVMPQPKTYTDYESYKNDKAYFLYDKACVGGPFPPATQS